MRTGSSRGELLSRGRVGLFAAAGALALTAIPAGAHADVIVPHAPEPHQVEVHAAPPPASNQAPAPAPAPASSPSVEPSSSSSTGSSHPVGDAAEPEESLPGADVPPADGERPYPSHLPSPWGPGCSLDCLIHWHDWYFYRRLNVQDWDPEAADLLKGEQDAIDDMIRQDGGVPGSAATDEPYDEPTGPNIDEVSGQMPTGVTGGSSGRPTVQIVNTVVDAISGAGPIVPENGPVDLGTVDLSPWIDRLAEATMLPTILRIAQKMDAALNGPPSPECPKKGVDDEVPVCQK